MQRRSTSKKKRERKKRKGDWCQIDLFSRLCSQDSQLLSDRLIECVAFDVRDVKEGKANIRITQYTASAAGAGAGMLVANKTRRTVSVEVRVFSIIF